MSNSTLYEEIVQYRMDNAAPLKDMLNTAEKMYQALEKVWLSPLITSKPERLNYLMTELKDFNRVVGNKYTRFSNGLVTVSFAGLEKSGKTTFLKKFTGIEELPTAAQRCTSVACEIICVDSLEKEKLVIEYYTREELVKNAKAMIRDMQQLGDNLWAPGRNRVWGNLPDSVEQFLNYTLPDSDDIDPFYRGKVCNEVIGSGTLLQLKAIKCALREHISRLGTEDTEAIENLSRYASHKTKEVQEISPLQPLIKKISVHKNYSQTMGSLRLCDTPGVDDPNPQAQRRALNSIDTDTDLLVIASRPAGKPTVTGLDGLLVNLKNLDKDVPWRERALFLINWDKQADPTGEFANIHKQEVLGDNTFDISRVKGPYDIRNDEEARNTFMEEVYKRLREELPIQDKAMMANLKRRWKENIVPEYCNIVKQLRMQAPPMEEEIRDEISALYDQWFDGTGNTSDPGDSFMARLTTEFGKKTKEITGNQKLDEMRHEVRNVLQEEYSLLSEWLEQKASVERCEIYCAKPENAIEKIMPELSSRFTETVKRVVNVVTNISPLVQSEVLYVLRYALGDEIAEELCGPALDESNKQLASFQNKMEEAAMSVKKKQVSFIAEQLKEFSNLSLQMAYILRHELRPCLNLLNPHHWTSGRKEKLIERSCALLATASTQDAKEDKEWLEQYTQRNLPSLDSPAAAHCEFLNKLAYCVCSLLETLVSSNEGQITELVEDYIEQACQTLASQTDCASGWKWGLRHYKHIILREPYAELEQTSRDSLDYRKMMKELDEISF